MLVWLPAHDLARRVGPVPGADVEVLAEWDAERLPDTASRVEVVVPPQWAVPGLREVLRLLPRLRHVQALTAGTDHLEPAVPPGVALSNAAHVHTPSTAEWVCAAVLACQRGLPGFLASQRDRVWQPVTARTLDGATVLLVGHGSIGAAVEDRLRPFGCRFLRAASREREGVHAARDLPALLPAADVVVVLVPLNGRTARLVDSAFLAAMPDGALLVNASRGGVVDTQALLAELRTGRLRAALDVTEPEPLPAEHPLWSAPGLLLTPHVGGAVPTMLDRQARFLAGRLAALAAGISADGSGR